MKRQKLVPALLVLVLFFSLASCAGPNKESPFATSSTLGPSIPPSLRIGLVLSDIADPFLSALKSGAQRQANIAGATLLILAAGNNPSQEEAAVRQLAGQPVPPTGGVSALILVPSEAELSSRAVQAANELQVPIITVFETTKQGVAQGQVLLDGRMAGLLAAGFLGQSLPLGGKVALLEGPPDDDTLRQCSLAFRSAIAEMNPKLIITSQVIDNDQRDRVQEQFQQLLKNQGELRAVFTQTSEAAWGVLQALSNAGRGDILLVALGSVQELDNPLQSGNIAAIVDLQAEQLGENAVRTALQATWDATSAPPLLVEPKLVRRETSSP